MSAPLDTLALHPDQPPQARIFWLHGLGADGHDLAALIPELNLPLPVRHLLPHAPVRPVTLNGGLRLRAWYDLYGLTAEAPQDAEGLEQARLALEALWQADTAQHGPLPTVLAGFSQGAALSLYAGLLSPRPLAGLVALSGYLPPVPRLTPIPPCPAPIWMAHGQQDAVIPLAVAQRSAQRLQTAGCLLSWQVYPHAHSISWAEIQALRAALSAMLSRSPDRAVGEPDAAA